MEKLLINGHGYFMLLPLKLVIEFDPGISERKFVEDENETYAHEKMS